MDENKNGSEENEVRSFFDKTEQYDPLKKDEPTGARSKKNEEPKISSPFVSRLENFFYHYKWHSIIALFLVIVIVFITLQNCTRTTYDAHIMYAGGKNVRVLSEGESEPTYYSLFSALERFVSDFDGDGERNVSFTDIYLPSDEEITAAEAKGEGVNYTLLKENDELFRQNILYGDYYVCILSEDLFLEWTKNEKSNPFVKISEYLDKNHEGYALVGEYGVYLNSTPTSDNPGFKNLPENSVLCFRKYTSSSSFSKKEAAAYYAHAEDVFRNILADKAYS